jgi:hypothetical protein
MILSKTDKTVSSNFSPLAVCIFILHIQSDIASHTILTSTSFFIFPTFQANPPWGHSKLTWISVENIHIQALFWIVSWHLVFPGLFYHQSYLVHYFLPLTVLVTFKKQRGQLKLFTWSSCEDLTLNVQIFSFTVIRCQNMYPHITHTKYHIS